VKRWELEHEHRVFFVYAQSAKGALLRMAEAMHMLRQKGAVSPMPLIWTRLTVQAAGHWDEKTCRIVNDPNPGELIADHGPPSRKR